MSDRPRYHGSRPVSRFWLLPAVFAAAVLAAGVAAAEPFVPADDARVLARVPVTSGSDRAELRTMRERLASSPQDLDLAAALARRYIALGRTDADPRYNGWAQAALQPWWEMAEPPIAVLVLRATILQNRHEFEAALQDLDLALARAPRNAQAWLTKATILRVEGKPREAAASCASLFGLTETLSAITCLGDAMSLAGKAQATRGDRLHLREQARFTLELLGDAPAALRLAEENWRIQREPADARIVLEAALAAGSPSSARPVLAWLDETGLEDVRLRSLAGKLREPAT
jgi:tetratricopeptide (TPR) repeat protein